MKLKKLPGILPGSHPDVPDAEGEQTVEGVTHDSRRVKPGWVFVAIRGHERDGGEYIEDAVKRGAIALVAERACRPSAPIRQFIVQDARRALAALASAFFNRPSRALRVIGVTGTNGKTTTTYMIRSILDGAGCRCGLLGTICYDTGRRAIPAPITTPESVDIQEYLAEMREEGLEYAAMEISSHALCMHRADFVQFAAGVFTNLSPEHMDYHGTLGAYRDAKARLFASLGPAGLAVLNSDDASCDAMRAATFANVVTYGLRKSADVSATVKKLTLDGIEMALRIHDKQIDARLPMIGRYNVMNALAAAAVTASLGMAPEAIRHGLSQMPSVPGRLEPVPCDKGCKVLVDFAHTDQALQSVLDSLRHLVSKRIIVVFGAGGDRDRTKRPRMGRVVEKGADLAWVTSDNPRSEDPQAIIGEILSGVRDRKRMRIEPDRSAAIREALKAAGPGDLVLIAGKGHERTQRFRDTVIPFDDREAVRQAFMAEAPAQTAGA